MHWLVDENIPKGVVAWLRERGDDVLDVADSACAGTADQDLWVLAGRSGRLVITRDLGFLWPPVAPSPPGIVIVRVPDHWRGKAITAVVRRSLDPLRPEALVGHVTVVAPGQVRQRPLSELG